MQKEILPKQNPEGFLYVGTVKYNMKQTKLK